MKRNVKTKIRLKSIDHNLELSEKKNRSHEIFLALPSLNTINNTRNINYQNFRTLNTIHNTNKKQNLQDIKIKTILIDKKVSKNLFKDISNNKNIPKSNIINNTLYTGFFVIPTTSKTVSIEKINIPITPSKSVNLKNSLKKNLNIDKCLYNGNFRFGSSKYSLKKKILVGEIFKSRGIKFFKNKKVENDFEVGGKFRSEEKDKEYLKRNIFNENMQKIIQDNKIKKFKKRQYGMNCREVLEFIKNDRYLKTEKLIKKTIEDKHRTKNNLHMFFKDFRIYSDDFDNWDNDGRKYI